MSGPVEGIYNIVNKATKTYMDVTGSNSAEGTPIIGYPLNKEPSGFGNQQFKLTLLPGTNVYTIQAVTPSSFVRVKDDSLVQDNALVGSAKSTAISIEAAGGDFYKFKIPNIDLVFTLKSAAPRTPVIIAPADGSDSQLWTLKLV